MATHTAGGERMICPTCAGDCWTDNEFTYGECSTCNGTGEVPDAWTPPGDDTEES